MSNKSTQYYRLHQLLKSSISCTKETVAKELGVNIKSVPVYIHSLKHKFKAEIETIKNGREVIAYKLVNKDTLAVPKFRSNATSGLARTNKVAKAVTDGAVEVLDKDLEIAQYSDREINDLHESIGLGSTTPDQSDY